ncbi:hypothetical protein V8B55DRAFT_1330660 [Mucor lusitanicus]|uniref:Uncharacterized protein n=2 Tax=Mucor circinelloides f. lusitanicus TaxID=29924 RepID=A0A168MK72_MUCCL|nr:hypothetical protein FB192DRAFT_1433512 [Mucor lusitanicus]OAD05051.1 hypothetical protein MUCCIDRAFT_161753 [Mucor lusitanicus CBS 277.49]
MAQTVMLRVPAFKSMSPNTKLPLKSPEFPDTVLFRPPPEGYLYKVQSKTHKLMEMIVYRVSSCSCEICTLNDADWQGPAVSIRWVGGLHHINIVLCPNGAAYELRQWVFSYPEGKTLVDGLVAKKRLIVDGKTTHHAYKDQTSPAGHVKEVVFHPKGCASWRPLNVHPPPTGSSNANGVDTAFSVAGISTKITIAALGLAGIL